MSQNINSLKMDSKIFGRATRYRICPFIRYLLPFLLVSSIYWIKTHFGIDEDIFQRAENLKQHCKVLGQQKLTGSPYKKAVQLLESTRFQIRFTTHNSDSMRIENKFKICRAK